MSTPIQSCLLAFLSIHLLFCLSNALYAETANTYKKIATTLSKIESLGGYFDYFCPIKSQTRVHATGTTITAEQIYGIQVITCQNMKIENNTFEGFECLPYLSIALFEKSHIPEEATFFKNNLHKLKRIAFSETVIPKDLGKQLLDLERLDYILISDLKISDNDFFSVGLNINSLYMSRTEIDQKTLNKGMNFPILTECVLSDTYLGDSITELLDRSKFLNDLNLYNSRKEKMDSASFLIKTSNTTSLNYLSLDNVKMDDNVTRSLPRFRNLQVFMAHKTDLTSKSIPMFKALSKRMYVSIDAQDSSGETFRFEKGHDFHEKYYEEYLKRRYNNNLFMGNFAQ